jgi:site-specific recombinase XerC
MPRKRLTLTDLIATGTFDIDNFRHRRALDESGPLADPELERVRQHVLSLRGRYGTRLKAAEALRAFAEATRRKCPRCGEKQPLSQFTTDDLYAFLDRHWGDSEGDTMGQRAACVRSFFAWATRSGRLERNPAEAVRVPRVRRRLRLACELADIRMLAAAQPRISDEAAVLVMGRLGLRKMEAARLQAHDVDLAHDLLYIRRAKGGEPAELPLVFADVRQALSLWLSEPGRSDEDYLIAAERGRSRPLSAPAVHRWFERCCERAGLGGLKLHELRHSAGDRLWRETGDLFAAKELLRHESVRTTQEYLHPTADDLRARMREPDR